MLNSLRQLKSNQIAHVQEKVTDLFEWKTGYQFGTQLHEV